MDAGESGAAPGAAEGGPGRFAAAAALDREGGAGRREAGLNLTGGRERGKEAPPVAALAGRG